MSTFFQHVSFQTYSFIMRDAHRVKPVANTVPQFVATYRFKPVSNLYFTSISNSVITTMFTNDQSPHVANYKSKHV